MREPKYRAWILGKMWDVKALDWNEEGIFIHTDGGFMHLCEEDDVHLLEFTGLLDKNSKEIYVGDIVVNEHGHKMIVEWDDNEGGYQGNVLPQAKSFKVIGWFKAPQSEVIGNIYEGELLK